MDYEHVDETIFQLIIKGSLCTWMSLDLLNHEVSVSTPLESTINPLIHLEVAA